jgi:hypothetical protein
VKSKVTVPVGSSRIQPLLPQETQDIPGPAGPPASLLYISLQPIDEGAIDVSSADEATDG